MNLYEARNVGPWILFGIVCVWPLMVYAIITLLTRRIKQHGWKSIFFGVNKSDDKSL